MGTLKKLYNFAAAVFHSCKIINIFYEFNNIQVSFSSNVCIAF